MSKTARVQHSGWGASTAPVVLDVATINGLGTSPHQTWAFRRAETTAFVGSPFRLPNGKPVAFARVRQLDPRAMGPRRMSALAERALAAARPAIERIPASASTTALLCLPERMDIARASDGDRTGRAELERMFMGACSGRGLAPSLSTIARGHASLAYALADLHEPMRDRKIDFAIALAVDTHYDPVVMDDLMDAERVLDSDSRDGFIPGEAATVLVLARADVARKLALPHSASIDSIAVAEEPATLENDIGMLGKGLSSVAVAVCRKLAQEKQRLAWWISDATPEPFRVQELQLAWPRAAQLAMTSDDRVDLMPTHLGDIGAATMPTALAIGIEGLRRGDPVGSWCMATASSPTGPRGAILVRAR